VLILFLIVEPSTTGSYSKDMLTKYNSVLATTDSEGNTGESSNPTSTSTVWSNGASSPTPKMESAYTEIGDKIYIIAGYGETGKRNKNSVEVCDTKTDTWTTAAPVPVNLNHAAAAALDDKIYLGGGYLDNKIPSNKLFIYDPATDAWQEGIPMPNCSIYR
jgi:N-acetylneuraminic acid mutarotase